MPIALTSNGVEDVKLLDEKKLDFMASWLCEETSYHDYRDAFHRNGRIGLTDKEMQGFEAQRDRNGGYCDDCRDFAGKILVAMESTHEQ